MTQFGKNVFYWVPYWVKRRVGSNATRRPKTLVGILNFYLSMGLITMTLMLSVAGYYFISHILQNALEQKAQALAEQVAITTIDAVLLNEYHVIERIAMDLVTQTPDLISIYIENQHQQVLAEVSGQDDLPVHVLPGLVITKPLLFLNNPAGHIRLEFSKASITQPLIQLSLLVALALLLMLGLLFLAVQKLLFYHVIEPVTQLCDELSSPQKVLNEPLNLKQNLPQELLVFNQAVSDLQRALQSHIQSLEKAHQFSAQATQNLCQSQRLVTVGQLAAGLAHNLNTPLANIIGYAQMALAQTDDEQVQKRLSVIERQAKSCSEQVKNLLQASKPPRLNVQPTDLGALIHKIIEMISPVVKHKMGGTLRFEHAQSALALLDVAAFEQVLFNLINNAIEAQASQVSVRLLSEPESDGVVPAVWRMQIEDDGTGILVELQQRVFEPFVSTKISGLASSSNNTNRTADESLEGKIDSSLSNAGTGLGLFLAKTLLKQMNGSLTLVRSNAQGTCFEIALPRATAHPHSINPEPQSETLL